jgi:hypothetical protein
MRKIVDRAIAGSLDPFQHTDIISLRRDILRQPAQSSANVGGIDVLRVPN